ncbi:Endocytosis and vacuole integrity protein [Lecanora helva]
MTAHLLTTELSTLIQESKRKNPELRTAAEKSLSDLKSLPRTSEAQIAADLRSRSLFVKPFLLACSSRNPKFAGNGINGLQRLVVSNALPKDTLAEVLEAFQECTTLALDIQLKVLQALPSLLQNYASALTGTLLLLAFQVCFLLYSSKTAVVSNTAAAALQQLVSSTFEKAADQNDAISGDSVEALPTGDGNVSIGGALLDAYRLLVDVCLCTDGQRPKYLQSASLAQNFGLELLASILLNNADTTVLRPEQIHILRTRLMPLVIRILSEKASFSTTVRAMRILRIIIGHLLFALVSECEMALSLLNHMLDPDAATPWKRALCLELYRGLHSEPALIRNIYACFDGADEKRNVIRDHLGSLVRLASEKPGIIGQGQQSSIPISIKDDSDEQAALQAGGLVGSIGAFVPAIDSDRIGINNEWSALRVPCIDILDKSEAPPIPATYIHSLTLDCVTTFSEGLARFLLPFTVPTDSRSRRNKTSLREAGDDDSESTPSKKQLSRTQSFGGRKTPVNPLDLKDHASYAKISTSGNMVEHCWPALLAASSTFLNARLDSEPYHALIRSFQKFTQIAGLLGFETPRDAFLTTLGKHAVPALKGVSGFVVNSKTRSSDDGANDDGAAYNSANTSRQSIEIPPVNTRHLLCLRALLNLGIALGPVLRKSWTIVFDTLLQVDFVLSSMGRTRQKQTRGSIGAVAVDSNIEKETREEDLGLEITAAETAASRMFEATSDLENEAFLDFLTCLCTLLRADSSNMDTPGGSLSPHPEARKHRKIRSVSNFTTDEGSMTQYIQFVIDKLSKVIQSNIIRLLQPVTSESGWDLLTKELNTIISTYELRSDVRMQAATTLNDLFVEVAVCDESVAPEEKDIIRARTLDALLSEVETFRKKRPQGTKVAHSCDEEIHRLALECLKSILEHSGDSLTIGWPSLLAIINSVVKASGEADEYNLSMNDPSPKLIRSAFDSIQLICSDFLDCVSMPNLLTLLDTLHAFSSQHQVLNISLTTATFFQNVSDYLLPDGEVIGLDSLALHKPSLDEISTWIRDRKEEVPGEVLWLYLLLCLVSLSSDDRLEVRHSSLRTLFNIFDGCSDQLEAHASLKCFDYVLIKLLQDNREQYKKPLSNDSPQRDRSVLRGWNETAITELGGISGLYSQWLQVEKGGSTLIRGCPELFGQMMLISERHVLDVSTAIFKALAKILSAIGRADNHGNRNIIGLAEIWQLWKQGNPALYEDDSQKQRGDNQEALAAYLRCLHEVIHLIGSQLSFQQAESILDQLWDCVIKSSVTIYSKDLDRMTTVQEIVLESLAMIPTRDADILSILPGFLARLVTLAYEQDVNATAESLTFVALSKAAMSALESCFTRHMRKPQFDSIAAAIQVGEALEVPIKLKYSWKREGKDLSPWKKATLTAAAIFEAAVPIVQEDTKNNQAFWELLVSITASIISADCEACADTSEIPVDRDFDMDAFQRMRNLMIPALGSHLIADITRRAFAESIFNSSLIHEPNIDDLAQPGQELLEGLRTKHIGRVKDLPPSPRSKLSYLLLDELFDLVSVHDGSPERIKLAQAAAPYLILRAGLMLKAYTMDQPLRGRMPQPYSQKKEMLYILRKLIALDSEPKAMPAMPGVTSEYKKHLHRLYPFVIKALKVAWRDEEMTKALQDVLNAVGDDFGI